jgi:hypothetical protein
MDPAPDRGFPDLPGSAPTRAAGHLRARHERRPVDAGIGPRTAVEEIGVRSSLSLYGVLNPPTQWTKKGGEEGG